MKPEQLLFNMETSLIKSLEFPHRYPIKEAVTPCYKDRKLCLRRKHIVA